MTFLPETIRRFSLRMPDIRLELFEGLLKIANPRLRDGSLDFFIGRPMPGDLGVEFNYRPLFSSSCAVVVRQGHPLANCRSLGDLCGLDWLLTLDPSDDGAAVDLISRSGHPWLRNRQTILKPVGPILKGCVVYTANLTIASAG